MTNFPNDSSSLPVGNLSNLWRKSGIRNNSNASIEWDLTGEFGLIKVKYNQDFLFPDFYEKLSIPGNIPNIKLEPLYPACKRIG